MSHISLLYPTVVDRVMGLIVVLHGYNIRGASFGADLLSWQFGLFLMFALGMAVIGFSIGHPSCVLSSSFSFLIKI